MSGAPITSVYAGLLALLFVLLSIRVINLRHSAKVAFGTVGDPGLERRTRVHANFAEYAPFALLLIAFVEGGGGPTWLVHGLGIALVLGRVTHAYGVSQAAENFRFRVVGMASTFGVLILAALALFVGALT